MCLFVLTSSEHRLDYLVSYDFYDYKPWKNSTDSSSQSEYTDSEEENSLDIDPVVLEKVPHKQPASDTLSDTEAPEAKLPRINGNVPKMPKLSQLKKRSKQKSREKELEGIYQKKESKLKKPGWKHT